mgnify:CR=1 FL=1
MDYDPKKLISESFKIDGISDVECRSIFFGWVLDSNDNFDINDAIKTLYDRYSSLHPKHPMTKVLQEGLYEKNDIRKRKRASRVNR